MVRAGKLRHPIIIQEKVRVEPGDGTWTTAAANVATVWGAVVPLSGRELFEAQQVVPDTTHRVEIRYYPGLTASHQLLHDGRVLQIQSVIDVDERKIDHHVMCKEQS